MTPREQEYYNQELNKNREELLLTIVELRMRVDELNSYSISNTDALTAMHKEFSDCKKECDALREENRKLKASLTAVAENEQLRVKDIFGRGTEKLSELLGENPSSEMVDEAETEDSCNQPEPAEGADSIRDTTSRKKTPHGVRSTRPVSEKVDLDQLAQQSRVLLDPDELDQKYGKHNWRIVYWKIKRTVEVPSTAAYCLNTYTPVLSVGLEHTMVSAENPGILPGSFVSSSFLAYVEYQRLFLSLPFYRMSESFKNLGLNISRQTLTGWFIRFAETHFSLVYDRLHEILMTVPYHQCDETFLKVINDGRSAGSFSYMWVHRTSELYPCHPIILYCYELTRGTDHLRKFYEDFRGYITCDAYCSYRVLESEKAEVIRVCGCMMHLRRRFAESLSLIDKKGLAEETVNALPEAQALKKIGGIYEEDEKLKNLDPEERKKKRAEKVRPLVEEFYAYIESLPEDPSMSNRLKDAIGYAENQKEYLCRFLEDGHVPIDDGATERAIRDFAISKKNSLFFDSVNGAKAGAVMYSILETAKANGVNVYLYLLYLLEEITKHLEDTNLDFLDAMLPWSQEYQKYEKSNLKISPDSFILGEPGMKPVLPKTPRKKDSYNTNKNVA